MITSIGRYISDVITEDGRLVTGYLTEAGDIYAEPLESRVLSGFVYVPIEAGGHIWHGSENPGNILVTLDIGGSLLNRAVISGNSSISISAGGSISSPNPLSGNAFISLITGGNLQSPAEASGNILLRLVAGGNVKTGNAVAGYVDVSIIGGGAVTIPTTLTGSSILAIEAGGTIVPIQDIASAITWVLNTITGGHSTYTNYNFNSFVRIGDNYYGFSNNGIFRLDGQTDDGTRLDWSVKTGISTYDTYSRKYVHDARITMRADGDIALREVVDEQTDRSELIAYSDERQGIHARRIKLPKGITGTAWQFEVYGENVNADIKELSVTPLVSQRTQ